MPELKTFDKQIPPYLMPNGQPNQQVFFKVDSTTHTVYGLATSEAVDAEGEIADYEGTKAEIAKWSSRAETVTTAAGQKPSKGNIRLQHDPLVIGGKVTRIDYLDAKKQIWIETQPANDEIWALCEGGFVTGFSISGAYLRKQREGDFTRYWPSIVEISYVDLPCNAEAVFSAVKVDGFFEYIKADGSKELRKFQKRGAPMATNATVPPEQQLTLLSEPQIDMIAQKTAAIIQPAIEKAIAPIPPAVNKEKKTKRVAGEDLESSAFAYVGDETDSSSWKLPLHFSTDEKSARHVRNALARFEQTKGIPAEEKDKVKAKIIAAAKKYGVEVSDEADKVHKAILFVSDADFPKGLTAIAIKQATTRAKHAEGYTVETAKSAAENVLMTAKLAKADLAKSMWDVHSIADVLQTLCWTQQCLHSEREYEGDDSEVPDDLKSLIQNLSEIFLSLAGEETSELLENLKSAAISGPEGVTKTMTTEELQKAHSVATKINNAKAAVTAHHKAMGSPSEGFHKDHHDAMHGHLDSALSAMKAATDSGDLKKAAPAASHISKAQEQMSEYGEKAAKMHKAHTDDMKEHLDGIHKAIGTDQSIEGGASGPGAGEGFKGFKPEDLQKAITDAIAPLSASVTELKKTNETLVAQNTELAKKVKDLEARPEPTAVRAVELPKGIVSIARETVGKMSIGGDTDDHLGKLAI